ncbi:DUF6609 family protein [Butyrivibrio fibrisolvens]|uniref:DUF6609 family protein n=1 Tax=Butyrivibrio fibrisolvens TaxID=831 RepID=UPI00047F7F3A|nr:DUF6609 family protein [Butyrivibrio fibrisolvens]
MDKLEFNNKKQCGLWLMLVGIVIVLSDISKRKQHKKISKIDFFRVLKSSKSIILHNNEIINM